MATFDRRQLLVIRRGKQRRVVPFQPHVANGHLGEQLGHCLQHPQPCPEDGDRYQVRRDDPAGGGFQRRRDLHLHRGEAAHGLDHDEDREALGQGAKHGRRRLHVSQPGQEMLGKRMVDHHERHDGGMLAQPLDRVSPDPRKYGPPGTDSAGHNGSACGFVSTEGARPEEGEK